MGNSLLVDARGRRGGLALLWPKDVLVEVRIFSSHHIEAIVDGRWRLMGFYGHHEAKYRRSDHSPLLLWWSDTSVEVGKRAQQFKCKEVIERSWGAGRPAIQEIVVRFYTQLFMSQAVGSADLDLEVVQSRFSTENVDKIGHPFQGNEVKEAVLTWQP
ncbi:hypothetical protein LIER_07796 [Lithospermum erythrorhizon]|uniref:Endonuclease/exonuclease/phosphatase n=1 Tax=Lithospermum erythrorhizon TaxID=34254 RepID=A0AAV3P9J2_LITER